MLRRNCFRLLMSVGLLASFVFLGGPGCTHDFNQFEQGGGGGVAAADCADAGLVLCGTRCTNTQSDPSSCGACGHDCGADGGATCKSGVCSCPNGLTSCPSGC